MGLYCSVAMLLSALKITPLFSVAMPMHMITTRKVDIFAPLIFTMEDLKEQLTPMVNGKLL